MGCTVTDKYVAENKMMLRNQNHYFSFVSTLWKGEVILCTFNNWSKEIINIYCCQLLGQDDVEFSFNRRENNLYIMLIEY